MDTQNQMLQELTLRLEKITEEVCKTQGYTSDSENLRMLLELLREQVKNENSGS